MNTTADTTPTDAEINVRTYVIILNRQTGHGSKRVLDIDPSAVLFDQINHDAVIITTTMPDRWDDLHRPLGMNVRVLRTADPDLALKVGRRQVADWRWKRLS